MTDAVAAVAASLHSSKPFLSITQQPSHVFANEPFDMEYTWTSNNNHSKQKPSTPPPETITVTLQDTKAAVSLEILQPPRWSQTQPTHGVLTARLVVSTTVTVHTTPLILVLSSNNYNNNNNSVLSEPLHIVTAKLQLVEEEFPTTWYKDEGGRDKCMQVTVQAVNAQGEPLSAAALHTSTGSSTTTATSTSNKPNKTSNTLDVQLCYESKTAVVHQDILRLLGRGLHLQPNQPTVIRFRIEDVSKNHQGQAFVLRLKAPNMAPCFTRPVTIRSKRNKRQRTSTASTDAASPTATATTTDPQRLQHAVQGIVQWSDAVVAGLYPLQWQVMGYAHHAHDGSVDYSRPYHSNMQNPNAFIARILGMYQESTRHDLVTLQQALVPGSSLSKQQPSPPQQQPFYPPYQHHPHAEWPGYPPPLGEAHRDSYDDPLPPHLPPPPHVLQQPPHLQQGQRKRPPPESYNPAMNESTSKQPYYQPHALLGVQQPRVDNDLDNDDDDDTLESRVEYVLAKQYKSFSTGQPLGFPAYSIQRELLGFFQESHAGVRQFGPLQSHQFTREERHEASAILSQALEEASPAVHSLQQWGSLASLLDHALVYDWSKELETK